jgi:hypothetical protein
MKCLILMPFASTFNAVHDVIRQCVAEAAPNEPLTSLRLDDVLVAGKITDQIVAELRAADLYIADITESNPNVMWEVGFAAAMQRPIIPISQSTEDLPFDIKDLRIVRYNLDDLDTTLHPRLVQAIQQTMTHYDLPRQRVSTAQLPGATARTIAVTGSSYVLPMRAAHALPPLLMPYLSADTTWYCGTVGACDEAAAEFLLSRHQRVVPVGFSVRDVSQRMLEIVQQHHLQFVDAEHEQFPSTPIARMGKRDILFLTRTQLLILATDGTSPHIRQMIAWAQQLGTNHLIGYV